MSRRVLRNALVPVLFCACVCLRSGTGVVAAQQEDPVYVAALKTGETALKGSKFEDAVTAFKQASSLKNKQSVDAWLGLSRAYVGLEAYKSAVQSCDEALKIPALTKRAEAAIHNQKGLVLTAWADKPGDPKLKDAEVEFRAVIEGDGGFPLAPYNLGVTLLKLNRDDEGIHELQNYLGRAGKAPEAELARKMIDNPRRARESYAPDFSVVTLEGDFVSLEDLKGKTVLLDFWGTWCGPCRAATPELVNFYKSFSKKANFVMLGIAVGESSDQEWKSYIADNKMTWLEYNDKSHKVATAFNVHNFPTYMILNGEGIIQATKAGWGGGTIQWIADAVSKTLKTTPPK